ncbi:hypothetical protein C7I87_06445 [Mesorhizobium sp. SARCC-RB16n]|uniref:gas vesicle accessory protein GvpU n=1 Tax=Mesorhizobium sp. SARCC-RB16n TaxID=2116687 RepID=UPI00122F189D|nr:gas vesicle accessory protein GvpU [Mesorhizobium sp. SARCC-RB16n]KAA3451641.1 hypothetical protein C7I87_06445 [Mesorhizobium sp. SARCC-RB16n]
MTTDQDSPNSERPVPVVREDWFLQSLVNLVNRTGAQIGITLTVGGTQVSGHLSSGKAYFEEFASVFAQSFERSAPEFAAAMKEVFEEYGQLYDDDKKADQPRDPPNYIHLKNVHIFTGPNSPIPKNDGSWWRGRIREVEGFILGTLGVDEDD